MTQVAGLSPYLCCHGPQKRAIQAMKDSARRADARRLDGRITCGHDKRNMKASNDRAL